MLISKIVNPIFDFVRVIFNIVPNLSIKPLWAVFMIMLILLLSFLFQSVNPLQSGEYHARNFDVLNGLPVNAVNGMLQDDNGYLWFSTMDGLVRYDGYDFRVFNSGNTPGMISNRIGGIIKTGPDELWLIHAEGLITQKSGLTFRTFSASQGDFPGMALRIIQAKNGEVWISTTQGIAVFNHLTNTFESPQNPLLLSRNWAMDSTFGGGIITLNENGLVLWENGEATLLLPGNELPIPPKEILQIKAYKPNEFWVMGSEGFFRFDMTERDINYMYKVEGASFIVWNLHPETDSSYIINTSAGFYSVRPDEHQIDKLTPDFKSTWQRFNLVFTGINGETIRLGANQVYIDGQLVLETSEIQSGLVDREGSVWVSTRRYGIYQIRKSDVTNITDDQIPGFENIYSVLQTSDGSIWAGSIVNGIFRINGNDITHWNTQNSGQLLNITRYLFEDTDGTMYSSIWGRGLWQYDKEEWKEVTEFTSLFDNEVTVEAMYRDRNGRLLIGTNLEMVHKENGTFTKMDASGFTAFRGVRVIRERDDGTLIFGTNGKGLIIQHQDETHHYTTANSELTSNFIRDVYIQSADTLWLATENLGLNRVVIHSDHSISVRSITDRDGLMINSLHRIIKTPDRYLWISSNGGLMRVSLDDLNKYSDGSISNLPIVTFNESNGMVNREANGGVQNAGILTHDLQLWFPNQKGITIVDPMRFYEGNIQPVPKPILEEIILSDHSIHLENRTEIQIPRGERNLRILFSAPNFSSSDRIQFRYKLEGVHPDWENASRSREAVLTNIPPGKHAFELMVYRIGSTDVKEASVLVNIPYHFYETRWFFGLMALLGLTIFGGGMKLRVRVIERREQLLQQRVDEQTDALKEAAEEKSRFFSGITHELKTPLALIAGPLEDILNKPDALPSATVRQLQMMNRNNYRLQNLVDQILDVTKLNSDAIKMTIQPVNFTEISRQIIGQFQSRLQQENIHLEFTSDPISDLIYLDINAWERIVINLLSNAIRFSPSGSTLRISIQNYSDSVSFSVKDEGIGIDEADAAKVFDYLYQAKGAEASGGTGIGLYLVKGLIEHMGGNIKLISQKGKGATFTVVLQKGFGHFNESDVVIHETLSVQKNEDRIQKTGVSTSEATHHQKKKSNRDAQKILLVEDNADFREYMESILCDEYDVLTAAEGGQALKIMDKNVIDLVISDVMMPGMGGLEFVANLRKKEVYVHLPVIFLSAKNHDLDVETGLSTGADIYLTKPIQSNLLLTQVAAVLRREKILKSGKIYEANSTENEFVKQIREIVYRQLANPSLNITVLADALFMSRTKLYKEWNKTGEISLNEFIKQTRMNEAKVLLTDKKFSVQETAKAVGYHDPNYFSTSFKKEFGVNPSFVHERGD